MSMLVQAAAMMAALSGTTLDVALDSAAQIHLPAPATGVVIGNPTIAGVSVQNERLLFVTGRSYGSTNLIVVGAGGRTLYEGRIRVTADEDAAVFVTRGVATVRLDCAPQCRRRPDLSDDPAAFSEINGLIRSRSTGGE